MLTFLCCMIASCFEGLSLSVCVIKDLALMTLLLRLFNTYNQAVAYWFSLHWWSVKPLLNWNHQQTISACLFINDLQIFVFMTIPAPGTLLSLELVYCIPLLEPQWTPWLSREGAWACWCVSWKDPVLVDPGQTCKLMTCKLLAVTNNV